MIETPGRILDRPLTEPPARLRRPRTDPRNGIVEPPIVRPRAGVTPSSDARQAIIEWLSAPRGRLISEDPPSSDGWRSSIRRPGGEDADRDGVSFVKERAVAGRQLHFVRFNTRSGEQRQFVVGVVRQADGQWEVRGNAGGGSGDPPRAHPWINFGAWGWPRSFCGGGRVIGVGAERAARARLRFADGPCLEDSVDAGIVLFMSEAPVRLPATVEIVDGSGSMLARYEAFKGL